MNKLKGVLLTQGMHGMISQVEGLAKALDIDFTHHTVEPNNFWKMVPPKFTPISQTVYKKIDLNDFDISNVKLMLIFMLAGPMTVIPLYLYVRGVELCGLGPTGMVFYITPTLQFLMGYFLYNEQLDIHKLISFILIWIAVSIYLKDLYEKN